MSRTARNAVRESLIVGDSDEMAAVLEQIEDAADNDVPVLMQGEPGSGRELVARAIHYASPRRGADFVAVKTAAIPRAMLVDELFGARSGTLKRAQGGTLLLKDVDALPRGPQRGLTKVLRRRESDSDVDVRFIGASVGDLEQSVAADCFERELYDRLGARKISIPPLRRRLADLPRLVRQFLGQVGEESGRGKIAITERAVARLAQYPWPGNVAELKDVTRRLAVRVRRGAIDVVDVDAVLPQLAERVPVEDMAFEDIVKAKLKSFLRQVADYPVDSLYDDVIARVERPLLTLVMEHAGQNQMRAAEILGLNRNTLRKKLAEHGLAGKAEDAAPVRRRKRK